MLRLLAVIFALTGATWGREITSGPINVAAKVGNVARMNATVNVGEDNFEWRSFVQGESGQRIFVSQRPDDILLPGYDVEHNGVDQYDLIFTSVEHEQAGRYEASLINDDTSTSAEMVSLSDLTCTNSAGGEIEVVEGQIVTMECSVAYYGYRAPVLVWSGMWSELILDEENPQRITYVTNVTAEASHDGMDFHCDLHFELADGDLKEPPTYTDNCHTNFLIVYAPTNIRVHPDPDSYDDRIVRLEVGEEINCTADGYPTISYNWYSSDMGHIVTKDTLTMEDHMVTGGTLLYRCEATNSVGGVPRHANKNVTLMVSEVGAQPTTGSVEDWIIAVAVVVPIVALVIIAAVIYFMNIRVTILLVMGPLTIIVMTVFVHMAVRWWRNKNEASKVPQKATPIDTVREPGPKQAPMRTNPTQQVQPSRLAPTGPAYANHPPAMSMLPVNQAGSIHSLSGRDSPGYGDLGIRQFGSSNPGLNSSVELDPHPTYAKPIKYGSAQQLPTNGQSGQSNQNYQRTPPEDRTPYIGAGSIV